MSHYDYEASRRAGIQGYPFYALIMAAMRQADAGNLAKLQAAFPDTWVELDARYNAPGGLLATDRAIHDKPACAQMPPGTKQWINSPTYTEGDR